MSRERIDKALGQLSKSRLILKGLLGDLQGDEWYVKPGGVTNLAWQTGHIAASQYALCLVRARGERQEDEQLVPAAFRKRYGRGSTPDSSPEANATPEELLATLDAVDAQVRAELAGFSDEQLDFQLEQPHPMFKTKLQAVEFCPLHEMMHVGQATLLRRLIGREARF